MYVSTRHRSLVSDSVKRNLRFCLNNRGFFHFLLARRFYAVYGVGFKRSWSCSARTSWAPRSPFPSLLNVFTGRPGYFAERRMTLKFSVLMGFIENRVNQVSGVFSQFLIHSVSWGLERRRFTERRLQRKHHQKSEFASFETLLRLFGTAQFVKCRGLFLELIIIIIIIIIIVMDYFNKTVYSPGGYSLVKNYNMELNS